MKLKLKQFIYIIVIAVFILITVFPIFWALVSSLRSDEEIFRYAMPFSWRTFVPDKLTFQSYINIFVEKHFGKVLFNTIFVGVATIVTGIIVNAVAGFIFAKYTFRFKRLLFFLVVLSFMVPFEEMLIADHFEVVVVVLTEVQSVRNLLYQSVVISVDSFYQHICRFLTVSKECWLEFLLLIRKCACRIGV